jgi:hypothetical protein
MSTAAPAAEASHGQVRRYGAYVASSAFVLYHIGVAANVRAPLNGPKLHANVPVRSGRS